MKIAVIANIDDNEYKWKSLINYGDELDIYKTKEEAVEDASIHAKKYKSELIIHHRNGMVDFKEDFSNHPNYTATSNNLIQVRER